MVVSGRRSVITPHWNEELQARSLITTCPSSEHVKGLLHDMLTCPFSVNVNFLRAVSGFLFGGAGWWRVVNKTHGLGPAGDFFQLSLPNLLYALYLYQVSNLKALRPRRPHEGQKLARAWMDTRELCRGAGAALRLPVSAMGDGWPNMATVWFLRESWKHRILCEIHPLPQM